MLTSISAKTDFFELYTVYIEVNKCFGVDGQLRTPATGLFLEVKYRCTLQLGVSNLHQTLISRNGSDIRKHTHYYPYTCP